MNVLLPWEKGTQERVPFYLMRADSSPDEEQQLSSLNDLKRRGSSTSAV